MRKKSEEKTVAKLIIQDAGDMTPRARKRVAEWLRRHARDLVKEGRRYSKRFTGRYLTVPAIFLLAALVSCSPAAPTPPPVPTSSNTCTVTGSGTCNIGNGNGNVTNPTPSPAASPGGDNVVESFAIFCYGFGAQPGQPEPNHNECALPVGYPNIAVTASPKNKAGVDVPNPGDKTSADVIDWRFSVSPPGAATLEIQGDNRFNAKVNPASPRVSATFTLVAIYKDPQGNIRTADKAGSIK